MINKHWPYFKKNIETTTKTVNFVPFGKEVLTLGRGQNGAIVLMYVKLKNL